MKKITLTSLLAVSFISLSGCTPANNNITTSITNFQECIDAENPAMESYPRQCRASGKTFVEEIQKPEIFVDQSTEGKNQLMLAGEFVDEITYSPMAGLDVFFENGVLAYFKTDEHGQNYIVKDGKKVAHSNFMDMSKKGDIIYTQGSDPIKVYFNELEIMQMDNCSEDDGCEMLIAQFSEDGSQIIAEDGQIFYVNDLKKSWRTSTSSDL